MKNIENKIKKITVTISPEILKLLDNKTSNRSHYLNVLLLEYFNNIDEDISKVKL